MRLALISVIGILFVIVPTEVRAQSSDAPEIGYQSLFEQGITYEEFLDDAVRRRDMWLRNTEKAVVPDSIVSRLSGLKGSWNLLAIAVDACSDSANIIPYLATFAGRIPSIDIRIVDSDVGRNVMEANRTPDGRPATPTIAVLSEDFEPLGFLIERPSELQEWALENKAKMSSDEFLSYKFEWYDGDLGRSSMSEVVDIIVAASR